MTSRPLLVSHVVPYWCLKTLKRRSCRFHKEILWNGALLLLALLCRKEKPFVECRFQFAVTLYIQLAFGTAGLLHLYLPRKLKTSFFHQKNGIKGLKSGFIFT